MKKIHLKTNCFLLLVVALIGLSSCSEKYYEYKNICMLNHSRNNDNIPINFQANDTSLLVVTDFKTKKKEAISFKVFELIDNVILNQFYIKNYNKIMLDFKRLKKRILDENSNSAYRKNIFYQQQVKFLGKKIVDKGVNSEFYERNVPFNNIGKMFESKFPYNQSNFSLEIENITTCIFENDSLSIIQLPKPKKIQWQNLSYKKKVKLLVYKINVKDKPYNFVTYLTRGTEIKEYIENPIYMAISQYSIDRGTSGNDHYYSVFFLSPQFANYKYTIKNLSRSFVNFNTNEPFSYIPYIKMYLCGKYSNKIMESTCDSAINSPQLKYIKSRSKCHYYAFYSEIYKKDMLVKLNTKHPEKIKVRDYKQ